MTSSDEPPTLGREGLLALAAWVKNKNEKNSSNESYGVGERPSRTTVSVDLSAGKNSSEADKTRINTTGGRQ